MRALWYICLLVSLFFFPDRVELRMILGSCPQVDTSLQHSAADSPGKPDALCCIAQSTHDSRVSSALDDSRTPQRGAIPHA